MSELVEKLRKHVLSRGGPAKKEDGTYMLPNGVWVMMLEAADEIERLENAIRIGNQ